MEILALLTTVCNVIRARAIALPTTLDFPEIDYNPGNVTRHLEYSRSWTFDFKQVSCPRVFGTLIGVIIAESLFTILPQAKN